MQKTEYQNILNSEVPKLNLKADFYYISEMQQNSI